MLKKFLILSLMTMTASIALGQTSSDAIITGTIADSTQSAVQGATVSVTNIATGLVTTVASNSNGQYRTPPLRIGEYVVNVEGKGFKKYVEEDVYLDIGAVRQINATLTPGEVSETVEVQASTIELLQKSDSTVGTVLTTQQIEELPLNGGSTGRDYLQLANLAPGTTPALSGTGGISIGGQSGGQVAFLLDGVDNNNQSILTAHTGQKEIIKPSVDAISEFKVVTTSYAAEYGRSSSGVVSVDLKSGTNKIHGSAYEFIRNDAVDALPDFSSKVPFKYNDFGGTAGGPIRKDRAFVFGDIEFFRLRTATTTYGLVPTAAQRNGQFSTPVYDPTTFNGTTRTQFPGDQITTGVDPVAARLLQYFPLPNFAGTGSLSSNNYLYNQSGNTNNYRWDVRADDALTANQSIFGRYSSEQNHGAIADSLPPLNGQNYAGAGAQTVNAQAFAVGYNVTLKQNLLANVRAGWNELKWKEALPSQSLTGVGIPGVATTAPGFSEILISNFETIGISNVPNEDDSEDREVAAAVTWTRGAHTFQFGWQEYWLQTNFHSSQLTSGIFSFKGHYTAKTPDATPTNDQRFADFLLGDVAQEKLSSPSILNFRSPYSHFYAQDDWKTSRSLTLNLGVRYELSPPAVDKFNKIANFDEDSNPASPQLVYAGEFGGKRDQRALQNVSLTNVAPRIGFAFSPQNKNQNSKTVLRGGYGIFYSNAITVGGMQSMENNPPVNQLRLTTSPSATQPSEFLQNGFTSDALSLVNANGRKNVALVSFDRHAVIPTDQAWNINVQRALPAGIVAEIGYYGNKFDHNWWQVDGNPAPATSTSALPAAGINANRRYQTTTIPDVIGTPTIYLGTVSRVWKEGWSQYNGLQAKAERRYSTGLTFIATYAYAKTLGVGDTADFQDPNNIQAERAVVATDMRHHFVGSTVIPLPVGHGQHFGAHWNRWLDESLGGWSLTAIVSANTGQPLNLTESNNPSNSGGTADRPNLAGNPRAAVNGVNGAPTGGPSQWFNTAAFAVQPSGTYGDAPRNAITGPGILNLDAGVHKTLYFNERLSAQIRLESFNATNTPHYGTPSLDVQSPTTLGQITSVTGNPRQNQLAVKIVF